MVWSHSGKIIDNGRIESDEHYTPVWIFGALGVVFDLDVAGHKDTNVPAYRRHTKDTDGLVQEWVGFVWMNPPYSNPTPWVSKFIKHNNGIALLPITRGRWFDDLWDCDCAIAITPYNMAFDRPSGKSRQIVFRTALFGLGKGKEIIHNYKNHKVR